MPDGTSKRHTPGDGSPAEPIPRAPDPRRPGPTGRERQDPEYDHNGEQVEGPLGFPDLTQDQAGRRSGRARRVANWFGFGAPPEEDEPDPYDRRPGFGRRDPYEADTGVYDYGRDQDADYDGDFEAAPAPTSGRTRRRTGSSHWEDVMLGSSPSPGTPMSDSIPGDTMPPDRLHREPPGTLPPHAARPARDAARRPRVGSPSSTTTSNPPTRWIRSTRSTPARLRRPNDASRTRRSPTAGPPRGGVRSTLGHRGRGTGRRPGREPAP